MDDVDSLAIAVDGTAFVRPLEDRAFQVGDVGETGFEKLLSVGAGAVADRAVSNDRCVERNGRGSILIGFHAVGAAQVADFVFLLRAHVQEKRWVASSEALGQSLRFDLPNLGILLPDLYPDFLPCRSGATGQQKNESDQQTIHGESFVRDDVRGQLWSLFLAIAAPPA